MIWMILAAQSTAQIPVSQPLSDVRSLFSVQDFPDYLLHSGEVMRTVYTRTTIGDDGTAKGCSIELSSGDAKLDAYTCAIIIKRGRFAPAKWVDGSPAYSVLRFPVTWTVTTSVPSDEERLRAVTPDLELSVNQLPKSAHKFVDMTLELAVDETGHIVSCSEMPRAAGDPRQQFPSLVSLVCGAATKGLTLRPPIGTSGKPMRSMQTASVQLTTAK